MLGVVVEVDVVKLVAVVVWVNAGSCDVVVDDMVIVVVRVLPAKILVADVVVVTIVLVIG